MLKKTLKELQSNVAQINVDNVIKKIIKTSTMDKKCIINYKCHLFTRYICGFSKRCHKANDLTESDNELHLTGATTLYEGYITVHIRDRY